MNFYFMIVAYHKENGQYVYIQYTNFECIKIQTYLKCIKIAYVSNSQAYTYLLSQGATFSIHAW